MVCPWPLSWRRRGSRCSRRRRLARGSGRAWTFSRRGPADAPFAIRILRSTFDWSYRLLSPPEQRVFRRLSVFRGGCTLESIEAVCNTRRDLQMSVEDGLASLLDKSLVQRAESKGEPRSSCSKRSGICASELLQDSGEAGLYRKGARRVLPRDCQRRGEPSAHRFAAGSVAVGLRGRAQRRRAGTRMGGQTG